MKVTFPKRPEYTCERYGYKLSFISWYMHWYCNKCSARYNKVQHAVMVMVPEDKKSS